MATGLYDPAYEHDACGVGMVADLHGRPDHDIVDRGPHRSRAPGAPGRIGGRGGDRRRRRHPGPDPAPLPGGRPRASAGFALPDAGGYAVGLAFLPTDPDDALKARTVVEHTAVQEGLAVLGWRAVPIEAEGAGPHRARAPCR